MKSESILKMKISANRIRSRVITTVLDYGDGHAGPSLSCADILAVLYNGAMNVDAKDPKSPDRDYFILSAGHKCLALYAALIERGFEDESVMKTYNRLDTKVPGHPDEGKFRGVDFSTGSLGHGLPLACGVATAMKLRKKINRVFVLMGDGEHGEGSVWESASFASHHKLDNIIAIVDRNHLQINGTTEQIQSLEPLKERYEAFGWAVKTVDGNNIEELYEALYAVPLEKDKPSLIIANTIKGKGLSFAENNVDYHHWNPKDPKEIAIAREDVKKLDEEVFTL
ncbi:MAG: transketolase [Erysipelotrichaceae bacterium]